MFTQTSPGPPPGAIGLSAIEPLEVEVFAAGAFAIVAVVLACVDGMGAALCVGFDAMGAGAGAGVSGFIAVAGVEDLAGFGDSAAYQVCTPL